MQAAKQAFTLALLTVLLTTAVVLAVFSRMDITETDSTLQAPTQEPPAPTVNELLEASNKERIKNNKAPLILNEKLSSAARTKANHMFANNYWAHVAPDGTTPWVFIKNAGYNYEEAGENLAKNYETSNDIIAAWLNSPVHRENMLKASYTEIGYAIESGVLDSKNTTIIVAMYGTPSIK